MPPSTSALRAALLHRAWMQWIALGVDAVGERDEAVVDPEALIALTAELGDADARLRDVSTDWCVAYGRYVNGSRLKQVVRELKTPPEAIGEYVATVAAAGGPAWPMATRGRQDYAPRGKARLDLAHAAVAPSHPLAGGIRGERPCRCPRGIAWSAGPQLERGGPRATDPFHETKRGVRRGCARLGGPARGPDGGQCASRRLDPGRQDPPGSSATDRPARLGCPFWHRHRGPPLRGTRRDVVVGAGHRSSPTRRGSAAADRHRWTSTAKPRRSRRRLRFGIRPMARGARGQPPPRGQGVGAKIISMLG